MQWHENHTRYTGIWVANISTDAAQVTLMLGLELVAGTVWFGNITAQLSLREHLIHILQYHRQNHVMRVIILRVYEEQ
jgi:hypothetical protein